MNMFYYIQHLILKCGPEGGGSIFLCNVSYPTKLRILQTQQTTPIYVTFVPQRQFSIHTFQSGLQ